VYLPKWRPNNAGLVEMMVNAWKSIGSDEILDVWDLQPE
jgi:hypothetical protein